MPASFYTGVLALDVASTESWYGKPRIDGTGPALDLNPLVRAMPGRAGRLAYFTATAAGMTWADHRLQKDGHKGWARALRVGFVLVEGHAIARNIHYMQRRRAKGL